jgi:ankyrin repeat protein
LQRQCNSTAWNGRLRSGRPSGGAAAAAAVDAQLLQPAPVPPLPQLTGLDRGMPPLHYAIEHNDLGLVRRLVAGGADVNQADPASGMQPLHRAVAANFFLDMTELLLSLGADVDGRDARGRTPLMTAASVIPERLVSLLLRAGGDVAARDANGQTALHHAAAAAHYASTIDALVQGGADMAAKDSTGSTPLHLAAACRKWHNATALVAAGASLEAKDNLGRTPLDHVDNPDWKRLLLAGRPAAGKAGGQRRCGWGCLGGGGLGWRRAGLPMRPAPSKCVPMRLALQAVPRRRLCGLLPPPRALSSSAPRSGGWSKRSSSQKGTSNPTASSSSSSSSSRLLWLCRQTPLLPPPRAPMHPRLPPPPPALPLPLQWRRPLPPALPSLPACRRNCSSCGRCLRTAAPPASWISMPPPTTASPLRTP